MTKKSRKAYLKSYKKKSSNTINICKNLTSVPSRSCGGGIAAEKCREKTVEKAKNRKNGG